MLSERVAAVEARIERAVARCGRRREDITLVAVTKVFPAAVIREGWEAGLRHFGENYVQEFETKAAEVKTLEGAHFHLIGHLQSNKARRASELFDTVQTIDTPKLARRLKETGKTLDVFIEVKLSPEEAKAGAAPEQLPEIVAAIRECPNLALCGLMTMPPWSDDPEESRPYFRRLCELARAHGLGGLSMGMSHDFEAAIEEGATHIRIGTALFGKRRKQ